MTESDHPRASAAGRSSPRLRLLVAGGLLAVLAALFGGSVLLGGDSSETISVTVPVGYADRLAAGEELELIPARLEVDVGDTLIIENLDDADHQVGPYVVGAGERLQQTFTSPGRLEGVCTIHPSGEIAIIVR